jgi:hypothetical protein
MPGRYERRPLDEIEVMLGRDGKRRRTRRHFTFLDWLTADEHGSRRRGAEGRTRFRTAAAERKVRDQERK